MEFSVEKTRISPRKSKFSPKKMSDFFDQKKIKITA